MDSSQLMPEETPEETIPGTQHTTSCDHFWVRSADQDPKSALAGYICQNCWSGISVDETTHTVENGTMKPRN